MAGRRTKGRKETGARGVQSARRAKAVLGNDPFERGAAARPAEQGALLPDPSVPSSSVPEQPETVTVVVADVVEQQPLHTPATAAVFLEAPEPAARVEMPEADTGAPASEPQGEPPLAEIRAHLSAIESQVESAAASATARLRELARQETAGQHTRDLLHVAGRLLPALRERFAAVASLGALFVGTREHDAYGMDAELAERAMPILDFLYGTWWRVEPRQIDNVPATGPAVVVANHGGILPWDALVLRLALLRDHGGHRSDLRPLLDENAVAMPVIGKLMVRLGAVAAKPENASELLERGGVVATFPEGSKAATRPWPDRYRVQRFGRGGFAKLALRTSSPIVPCAIVGSEETSLPMARAGWLSDLLGMPFLKAPPAGPLVALGVLPLPARWSLRFGPPIETASLGPDAASDPGHVLEVTERVRSTLQQMLDEDVAARRSVFL